MGVSFETVKPHIGTIVHLDHRDDIVSPDVVAQCNALLEKRTVLVFPRVNLTDEEQLAFTDAMGGRINLTSTAVSDAPAQEDVYKITLDPKINSQPEYVYGTFFWHMDGITVDTPPPRATLLSCRKASATGGQTEFASTYAAWEELPAAEQEVLKDLRAVHSVRSSLRAIQDAIPDDVRERVLSIGLVKEHPLVWRRASGRASFVIGSSADHIVGRNVMEGRALITRLNEWAGQPDFSYRHYWLDGDFVVWDNCGALHRVIPYTADSGRMMHRTTIAGTESVT